MRRLAVVFITTACGLVSIGGTLSASTSLESDGIPTSEERDPLPGQTGVPAAIENVIRLRAELAKEIASGAIAPTSALDRLKSRDMSFGQSDDPDVDSALGAIDIGQQLNGSGFVKEALVFFGAAETSLARALSDSGDRSAATKVQLLQQLALLRWRYLDKPVQAEKDLAEALSQRPDDDYLLMLRGELIRSNRELFKTSVSEDGRSGS